LTHQAPEISAKYASSWPGFSAKQSKKLEVWFLNMPPQEEIFESEEPSELHLIQFNKGGFDITSIICGALGGVGSHWSF